MKMVKMYLTQKLLMQYQYNVIFVKKDYQQDLRVLYVFIPNKSFCQLLDISAQNFIFLKFFYSEFSCIEVWFTDQNSKPVEVEDKSCNLAILQHSVKFYYKHSCQTWYS